MRRPGATWSIRPKRAGDGAEMMVLHKRAIMATHDDYYSMEQRRSWAFGLKPDQYQETENGHFDVAEADDVVIAFCNHLPDEVLGLYIDPDWQGCGIGSAFMRQAEMRMVAAGTTTAKIHSALSSQSFYERHGYTMTEYTQHLTRGGLTLPSVKLQKSIG